MFHELKPVKSQPEYLIVEFPEEISEDHSIPMAIISSTWVFEQNKTLSCYWPSYIKSTSKRDKAVACHEALLTDKCSICPIIVKFTSEDYKMAMNKLKLLEEAESSQTEVEADYGRSQKVNRDSDFAYSLNSSSDEEALPKAPKPPRTLSLKEPESKSKLASINREKANQFGFLQYQKTFQTVEETQKKPLAVSSVPSARPNVQTKKIPNANSSFSTDSCSVSSGPQILESSKYLCSSCKKNEVVLEEIVRGMESLREDMKFLIQINQDREQENKQFIGTYDRESFKTIEELQEFERELCDDEYFQKTCIKLSLVGGKDGATATRRILATLMSHELSLKINWSGRNEKGGLKDFHCVIKCISAAVRRNPNSKHITNDEIQTTIKSWLRNAADREGGRSKRNKM